MKKIIKEGTFVDFKGLERNYTICAAIQDVYNRECYWEVLSLGDIDISPNPESVISIGLAVCHEQDMKSYNSKIGKMQAEGRALKCKNASVVMTLDNYKFATDDLLNNIADTFEKDFKRCPGKYIKGYNDAEIKWRKKHEQEVNIGCGTPFNNN